MHGLTPDAEAYLPVATIARSRGVTRQTMHERVRRFLREGRLPYQGEGKSLRVHVTTLEELLGHTHDPAQDLRNRKHRQPDLPALPASPAPVDPAPAPAEPPRNSVTEGSEPAPRAAPALPSAFEEARTRQAEAQAQKLEMELAQRRGELVPAGELAEAAADVGGLIAQTLAALKSISGELYAAGRTGGEDAVYVMLCTHIDNATRDIARAMGDLAIAGARAAQDNAA